MVKIDRLLGIEKKLNITITMPQICYFCEEEITKKFGKKAESLLFHSLDGNNSNWEPSNKVSTHRGCHTTFHRTGARLPFVPGVHEKKVVEFGGNKAVILPKPWYVALSEKYPDKVLIGVYLDTNDEEIRITPMWEDEK